MRMSQTPKQIVKELVTSGCLLAQPVVCATSFAPGPDSSQRGVVRCVTYKHKRVTVQADIPGGIMEVSIPLANLGATCSRGHGHATIYDANNCGGPVLFFPNLNM